MNPVIHFNSRQFDLTLEHENPINPIRGSSLLDWLRERVPSSLEMTETEAEDWGWYSSVNWEGRNYLVGSSAHENVDGNHEWVLQIDKKRSDKEILLGQAKMTTNDPCFTFFKKLIEIEPSFTEVTFMIGLVEH